MNHSSGTILKCARCGYVWEPRLKVPMSCAGCATPIARRTAQGRELNLDKVAVVVMSG